MREEWKDIKGYEGYYQVSNLGRVKSLERKVWNSRGRGYYMTVPEKILEGVDNGYGYLRVYLCKDGKVEHSLVHVLVATAFLDNADNLPEVNHKDEDKANNCVDNLEFCSSSYNKNYGTRNKKVAEKLSKPVFSINKESGLITYWESIHEASRQLNINQGHIWECCNGKRKSAGGFYWMYKD